MTIDWDLSTTHTRQDIGEKPDSGAPAYHLRSVESIRVMLPGGRVFEADDVQDIRIDAEGDEVEHIAVVLHPRAAEEAHTRASELANQWDLRSDGLDGWLEDVEAVREKGGREADVGQALAAGDGVEPVPFAPSVEIRYSFDDETPWVVGFNMYWNLDIE